MTKFIYIFFIFISSWAFAQSPTFISQVSKNRVGIGEIFTVSFTLNGSGSNLVYPNFKGFDIYSGPNQSQSISMVNGTVSQSTSLSFYILAKTEGKFTIGSATIMSGNQKLETKPIIIEVVKGNAQPQQQNPSQTQQANGNEKNQYSSELNNEDVFVKSILNKSKCYKGEQIHLSHKIYSRHQIIDFGPKFLAKSFDGFWNQVDINKTGFTMNTETVNGVNYYVVEIYNTYLFPQRTGNIIIEPVELECIVRQQTKRQPRNIIEQFFGTGGYEDVRVKIKCKPLKVDVIDLPTENKPADFNGAVGDFSYKVSISKNEVKENDAFNLKFTISGTGNIKLVELLKLNLPESFETYDPKINENIKTIGGVSGSKTYDYLIIPREKGDFVLNNLGFSYFDASKKKYVSIPAPDISIKVLQGDGTSAQIISSNKKEVKETENDLRYIKTGDLNLKQTDAEFFSSSKHYILLIIPFLLFITGLLVMKQHIKANSNIQLVKERKAAKLAKKQLSIAEKHLKTNSKDLFFYEVLNALNNYIGDKFSMSVVDFSKEKISEMLLSRNVKKETTNKFIETLNTCEYAKYAPSAVTADLNAVYNDTLNLISKIEEQIKK